MLAPQPHSPLAGLCVFRDLPWREFWKSIRNLPQDCMTKLLMKWFSLRESLSLCSTSCNLVS